MLDFETYCKSKRINPEAFLKEEPTEYHYLKNYFEQVHPDSFTAQKLFAINQLRRKYLKDFSDELASLKAETPKPISKPAIAIKPKMQAPEMSVEVEKTEPESPKPITKAITRPVIKPKIPTAKTEDVIDLGEKPKTIPKPLMKPKIQVKADKIEEPQELKETPAIEEPKVAAVLKPKISPLRPKIPPKKE